MTIQNIITTGKQENAHISKPYKYLQNLLCIFRPRWPYVGGAFMYGQ